MNRRMFRQMQASRRILNRRSAAPVVTNKECPYCGRLVSRRETIVGACSDCAPRETDETKSPAEAVDAANEHDVERLRRGPK